MPDGEGQPSAIEKEAAATLVLATGTKHQGILNSSFFQLQVFRLYKSCFHQTLNSAQGQQKVIQWNLTHSDFMLKT